MKTSPSKAEIQRAERLGRRLRQDFFDNPFGKRYKTIGAEFRHRQKYDVQRDRRVRNGRTDDE